MFELGSITKAVTGLLLADAVVRGEVALDTHARRRACPGARPLRARRPRVAHRRACRGCRSRSCAARGLHQPDRPLRRARPSTSCSRDLARVRVRGSRMRYSNFGAALLGQALAARAGAPYERLVEERVLRPLGVEEVWARGAPRGGPAARPPRPPVPPWELGAYAPAGCLRGTARGALALSTACLDPPARDGRRRRARAHAARRSAGRSRPGSGGCARRSRAARRCGGTTAAPTARARSPASCRRRGEAVAALTQLPEGAGRPRPAPARRDSGVGRDAGGVGDAGDLLGGALELLVGEHRACPRTGGRA